VRLYPARYFGRATGRHRAPQDPQSVFPPVPPSAVVPQAFVHCKPCGVETAATIHGGLLRCTEGHEQPGGGAM